MTIPRRVSPAIIYTASIALTHIRLLFPSLAFDEPTISHFNPQERLSR